MNHHLVGLFIDTTGAFLMMLLALWVWRVRPENRLNRTFAALVSTLAVSVLFLNIGWVFHYAGRADTIQRNLFGAIGGILLVVAGFFILRLERRLPAPRGLTQDPVREVWPLAIAGAFLATVVLSGAVHDVVSSFSITVGLGFLLNGVGFNVFAAITLYFLTRLALRYAHGATDEDHLRWQAATMAMALGAFPLYATAAVAIAIPVPGVTGSVFDGLALIPLTLTGLTWIGVGIAGQRRLAIVTGLVLLAFILAGLTAASLFGSITAINSGALGILRLGGTALFAYTIVRHQLFDIELKVKWTLSRGTVAGIFIATFFVFSEGAQDLFSSQVGPVWGLVAAGLLVFAIAPLQRFADRLSDAALPHVADTPAYREERRRQIYLAALRSARGDGIVTDRERNVLATLADELGLSARDALDLERQAVPPMDT